MGAALKPDYFHEKVRLFVALAPIVRLDNITSTMLVSLSAYNEVLAPIVKLSHAYSLAPYNYKVSKVITTFCTYLVHLCEEIEQGIYDWNNTINNIDRYDDY